MAYLYDHAQVERTADRIFRAQSQKMEGAFLSSVKLTVASDQFQEVLKAVRTYGEVPDYLVNKLSFDLRPLGVCIRDTALIASNTFYKLGNKNVSKSFINPDAESFILQLLRQGAVIAAELDNKTRNAVRSVMAKAIKSDMAPDEIAVVLSNSIGLDDRYAVAVESFRVGLINRGVSKAQARKQAAGYAAKLRSSRAKTIARTETSRAIHVGQRHAYNVIMSDLGIPSDMARIEWITATDERTCPNCAPMNGVQVKEDEAFSTPIGDSTGPPLHPNCRCTTTVRFPDSLVKGDYPGHPFRGNQWTDGGFDGPVLQRGVNLKLSEADRAQVERWLKPPTTMEEVDQDKKIGPLLVSRMSEHEGGLGRHWTSSPTMADNAARQGGRGGVPVRVTARTRSADVETDKRQLFGNDFPDEKETTFKPGAQFDVVDVELMDVAGRWFSVWPTVAKGDYPGHPFRGNQWTSGRGVHRAQSTGKKRKAGTRGAADAHIKAVIARERKGLTLGGNKDNKLSHVTPQDVKWALSQRGDPTLCVLSERVAAYGITPDEWGQWLGDRFPSMDTQFEKEIIQDGLDEYLKDATSSGKSVEQATLEYTEMTTGALQALDEMSALYPGAAWTFSAFSTDPESLGEPDRTGVYGWAAGNSYGRYGGWPGLYSTTMAVSPTQISSGQPFRALFEESSTHKLSPSMYSQKWYGSSSAEEMGAMAYATTVHEWGHIIDYHSGIYSGMALTGFYGLEPSGTQISRMGTQSGPIEIVLPDGPTPYGRGSIPEFKAESFAAQWLGTDPQPTKTAAVAAAYLERVGANGVFDLSERNGGRTLDLISKDGDIIKDAFPEDSVVMQAVGLILSRPRRSRK